MSEKDKVTYEIGPLVMHTHPAFNTVAIERLTDLANDLTVQNAAIRNKLDKVETQRDELLEALTEAYEEINYYANAGSQPLINLERLYVKLRGE